MLWTILSVACGLFFLILLLGAGFVAYLYYEEAKKERIVRRDGRPIQTSLVMANNELYDPSGGPQLPGVVVFHLEPPSRQLAMELQRIASHVYDLYSADDVSRRAPYEQRVAAIIKDHNYHENRRNRLPVEMTGGRTVYLADLWIHRERLPSDWSESRTLACKATIDPANPDRGRIIHLGLDEAEAQRIYAAS